MTARPLLYALFVASLAGSSFHTAAASEDFREPSQRIAQAVKQVLGDRGVREVSVGDVLGPPSFGSAAGPGIKRVLSEELEKQGVSVRRLGARFGLRVEYRVRDADKDDGRTASLELLVAIVDDTGAILADLNTNVDIEGAGRVVVEGGTIRQNVFADDNKDFGQATVLAETLGGTIDLDAKRKEKPGEVPIVDGDDVLDTFDKPTADIRRRTAVAASRESPFELEIFVRDEPLPVTLDSGHPFVDLQKGDVFEIRVTNRARFDAAMELNLDGISSFAFSDIKQTSGPNAGEPKYSRWILQAGRSYTIKGWHRTNQTVDEFLVTDFSESAAAKLSSPQELGTITATFRAAWRANQQPPPDEREELFGSAPIGIGQGNRIGQRVLEERNKRELGRPRAVITVRYVKPGN